MSTLTQKRLDYVRANGSRVTGNPEPVKSGTLVCVVQTGESIQLHFVNKKTEINDLLQNNNKVSRGSRFKYTIKEWWTLSGEKFKELPSS